MAGSQSGGRVVYGISPAMRAFERAVADLAPTNIPILLGGEGGTGKELFAQEIHRRSRHSDQPFLKYKCARMSPESLPAEFRAKADNGMSEPAIAFGCTIFLDEISQLDFLGQDRLLKLLLEAELVESGSYLGARLISATTRDLEEEMGAGRFRRELYYRISGVYLRLPALRDRKEDIPALLDLFLHKYALLFGRAVPIVDDSVLDATLQYSWAGNVRELENFARTIVAVGDAKLALSHLGINGEVTKTVARLRSVTTSPNPVCSLKQAAREASRKAERELILKALERTRWNRKRTALELQISYKALLYKLKQMNLDGSDGSKV